MHTALPITLSFLILQTFNPLQHRETLINQPNRHRQSRCDRRLGATAAFTTSE
ncbi:hypothetical protein [Nostoc sp. PCC 7524]|uniref:hypothetical protein n=1 Tax=Nostoc sp. (strain ATCC 29411 / PCC 7524) TaxID=28072 RepID=UPI000AE337C6|nr:hypothetical protein [Nostoc sp. PCC 7524]